jgi:hypothetical protein
MGWGRTVTWMPFGQLWQKHRKIFQNHFSNSHSQQWCSLQTREARKTVDNIIENPANWELSLRRLEASFRRASCIMFADAEVLDTLSPMF